MGLQTGKDVLGIAKQSGKGTIAANPYFLHGLTGGGLAMDVGQDPDPITSAYLNPSGAVRTQVANSAAIQTRAWLKAIGLYLYGALGAIASSQLPAATAIATSSVANPTVITTSAPHGQGSTGTKLVTIAGHSGSTPAVSGSYTATMTGASTFTVPVDVSTGGTGGTVTFPATSYVHVITLGSALPYLTVFEQKGDSAIMAVKDCKIDELELSWDENKPLELTVKTVGGVFSFPATFVGTVDESDTSNYYSPVGGTFKLDVDSSTPVTASITAGKITIKRNANAVFFSGALEAGDVEEGDCSVDVSFSVLPDDTTLWRTLVTGTVSGTAVASTPLYGSFEHTFVSGTDSLKIAAASVAFLCDLPEAEPSGGSAVSQLAGVAYRAATATPITCTLGNQQASY